MDCTYILFKNIFPDPKAAKQFSSAGTKREAMVKYVPELILLRVHYIHLKKTTYLLWS
jgi:hypothetical protein